MSSLAKFFAYADSLDERVQFSLDGRDEDAGWLGTISAEDDPVASGETVDEIEAACYAYLGCHPQPVIYITDAQKRVIRTLTNREHHQIADRRQAWILRLSACLVFAIVCLGNADIPYVGTIWAFALTVTIYLGIVWMRLQDEVDFRIEIESALYCYLMQMIALIAFGGG